MNTFTFRSAAWALLTCAGMISQVWAQTALPEILVRDQRCGLYTPVTTEVRDAALLVVGDSAGCTSAGLYWGAVAYGVRLTYLDMLNGNLRESTNTLVLAGRMDAGRFVGLNVSINDDRAILYTQNGYKSYSRSDTNDMLAAIDAQAGAESAANRDLLKALVSAWGRSASFARYLVDSANPIVRSPFLSASLGGTEATESTASASLVDDPKTSGGGAMHPQEVARRAEAAARQAEAEQRQAQARAEAEERERQESEAQTVKSLNTLTEILKLFIKR